MTPEDSKILAGNISNLGVCVAETTAAARELGAAGKFICGPYFVQQVVAGLQCVLREESSPWVNREAAAARWFCSVEEIDRAVRAGILTKHLRGTVPLFEKSEGDKAIREKRWEARGQERKSEGRNPKAEILLRRAA